MGERICEPWLQRWARGLLAAGLPLELTLWNGRTYGPVAGGGEPHYRVHIGDRSAFCQLLADPDVAFGDLYSEGRVEVNGDLIQFLVDVYRRGADGKLGLPFGAWLRARVRRLWGGQGRNRRQLARRNATHHYDVGNEFYRLWLDDALVYSCAYFRDPDASLEEAQRAKLEHICRKLELKPGEHVIDVGSGWGALALHMARRYGVTVRGYNLSREQLEYARGWAETEGLADQVAFVECDYRDIDEPCDALVSVGMLEHVGASHYLEFGRMIDRCLRPDGRGLLHMIGLARPRPTHEWLRRTIFPGGQLPALREVLGILEPFGMPVLDVENLRLHYSLTLRHWFQRYQRARRRAAALAGERTARAWELYLAAACASFEVGSLELFQVLFTRPGRSGLPWTRAHLYR